MTDLTRVAGDPLRKRRVFRVHTPDTMWTLLSQIEVFDIRCNGSPLHSTIAIDENQLFRLPPRRARKGRRTAHLVLSSAANS